MALQGHVANKNHHISIIRVSMATKLGRMIASLDGLLPIMSHNPLITWPCEIRGSFTGGGSAHKRLSPQRLLVAFAFNAKSFAIAILVFFLFFLLATFSGRSAEKLFGQRFLICYQESV